MRVLLTGASGFIGSHVARALLSRGHDVHALLRPASGLRRIEDLTDRLTLHRGPLDRPPLHPDLLVHLAWTVVPGAYLEAPENETCLAQSRRLLERLRCRAVAAGTCFEYDTRLGTLTESSPTRPATLYARTKDALRRDLERRGNGAWMRIFYAYGPGEDPRRFVPKIVRALLDGREAPLSPGRQRRDYLHVADVAAAVCAVAESGLEGPVNIGSGTAPTVREIALAIADAAGRPDLLNFGALPYGDGEPMFIVADNALLRSTGWAPRRTLPEGLSQTVDWWRTER